MGVGAGQEKGKRGRKHVGPFQRGPQTPRFYGLSTASHATVPALVTTTLLTLTAEDQLTAPFRQQRQRQ